MCALSINCLREREFNSLPSDSPMHKNMSEWQSVTSKARSEKALFTHSRKDQLPCHKDTQAAPRKGPCGKKLWPPSNRQQGTGASRQQPWPQGSLQLTGSGQVSGLKSHVVVVVQLLSRVQHFVTPWITASQSSLSFTISWSLLKLMSFESVMISRHHIFCCPLFSSCPQSFPASGSFHERCWKRTTQHRHCWTPSLQKLR